jgi:hypothetical protein
MHKLESRPTLRFLARVTRWLALLLILIKNTTQKVYHTERQRRSLLLLCPLVSGSVLKSLVF